MPRALCKMNGCLVIAEFTRCEPGTTGKCPCCHPPHRWPRRSEHGMSLVERDGWLECEADECDFAILKSDYEEILSEPYPFIGMGI